MEDSRIVDLYWARDEQAIDATAKKYGRYCYRIAFNILSNNEDANESVNDTYMGAWKSMPPHRPSVLSTFLGKLTRRISLNKWRNQTRTKRGGGEVMLAFCGSFYSTALRHTRNLHKYHWDYHTRLYSEYRDKRSGFRFSANTSALA